MPALDGKVAIVTGAGRGIGREHALALASAGAKLVVNDLGGSSAGEGQDQTPAQSVADEIKGAGGEAVANYDNVADFQGAEQLVKQAIGEFGRLDILVNNAGIIRDRMLVNLAEDEWDAVINVHLKGHFGPTRHAAAYWREQSKAGQQINGRVINTSSPSGVFGNVGQTNYGAAKAGIAAFTIIAALERVSPNRPSGTSRYRRAASTLWIPPTSHQWSSRWRPMRHRTSPGSASSSTVESSTFSSRGSPG
jgi:NAD(P)-dependent dehydrogenase (short-subunit alcohol dehydrogenase family)